MKRLEQLLLIICFCVLATASFARNYTNWPVYMSEAGQHWPKAEEYNSLVTDLTWVYVGLSERCLVAGMQTDGHGSIAPAQGTTRSPSEDIGRFKLMFGQLSKHFIDSSYAVNGNFNQYFDAGLNLGEIGWVVGLHLPRLYAHSIYKAMNLPENFASYTPSRCLKGMGPNSSDPVINYHGWKTPETQAQAAGTDNLPEDRQVWYTTDYALPPLCDAVERLKWTLAGCGYVAVSEPFGDYEEGEKLRIEGEFSLGEAVSQIESAWNSAASSAEILDLTQPYTQIGWHEVWADYSAGWYYDTTDSMTVGSAQLVCPTYILPGNVQWSDVPFSHSADFYAWWDMPNILGISGSSEWAYHYQLVDSLEESAEGETQRLFKIINSTIDLPETVSYSNQRLFDEEVLIKWDGPNGFTRR